MEYLMMFTIGPVQSFIENSRKARDLYAGSMILSKLMQEAVCWLENKDGVEILFPVIPKEAQLPNMPNRLIAKVRNRSEKQLKESGEALSGHIRQKWIKDGIELLKQAGIGPDGCSMAKAQLEDYLEIFWMYEPYEDNYQEAYQKLFTAIHDVKGIREFKQSREPWGRKCMLFPEYGAIFVKRRQEGGKASYPYNTNPEYACDISDNPKLRFAVKDNEALCAMALVKRIYGQEQTNIYSIRQMMLRNRVRSELLEKVSETVSSEGLWDDISDIIYELKNGNSWPEDAYPKEAEKCARDLYKWIQEEKIILSSYYALVKFDGDSMGEQFKGLKTSEEQQNLSLQISKFAYDAPKILLKYGGLPVFAGGEDFLGYLPLDGLFDCMKELHTEFLNTVGLTFSAGIVVAHLMQPMKEVVMLAGQMEHEAKNKDGKNAFAIGILKRSGEFVNMPACHFTAENGGVDIVNVKELVRLLSMSGCSKSLFFQISSNMDYFVKKELCPPQPLLQVLLKKCVTAAYVDGTQTDKEKLLQELLLFSDDFPDVSSYLYMLNGIVFLSREVN